jgi:predicted N-formylglutamate amidohydrolase
MKTTLKTFTVKYYGVDRRVSSVMLEIRRDTYDSVEKLDALVKKVSKFIDAVRG